MSQDIYNRCDLYFKTCVCVFGGEKFSDGKKTVTDHRFKCVKMLKNHLLE